MKRVISIITAGTITAAALVVAVSPTVSAAPAPAIADGWEARSKADQPKPWKCKNKAAQILYEAGFTGWPHKMAWAITYRESKHQNLDENSPWYTGALGMWQIQTSAHLGKSWWSRSAMLDPLTQSRIVYKHMTNKGKSWVPWGLNPDGSLNTTQYGGWSSWQHQNWIMAPFQTGLSLYPCKTTPPKK